MRYSAFEDPYCYPGTRALRNIPGLKSRVALERFEAIATAQRADEPLPAGRLGIAHYRAVHRHLFQDVYDWAGRFRTVALSKDGNVFCYPGYIPREMDKLFKQLAGNKFLKGVPLARFLSESAHFLAELNAIHPFREGNGRTQTTFLALLATKAGRTVDFRLLRPRRFLAAMIASFDGDEQPLKAELTSFIR
jgi:cell filamentation protein